MLLYRGPELSWERLHRDYGGLLRQGLEEMEADGLSANRLTVTAEVDLRYRGQSYTLSVPWGAGFREEFHARHFRLYGHSFPEAEIEAVVLRLHLQAPELEGDLPPLGPVSAAAGKVPSRDTAWLPQGPVSLPIYYRPELEPGEGFPGPALIVEDHATLLVLAGFQVRVLPPGHLLLTRV
jgi:N-methylhydantoinase A